MSRYFVYTNPHPKGCEVGDCVKRAFTLATGETYQEISRQLNRIKRELHADAYNANEVWWEFVNRHKWIKTSHKAVKGQPRMNGKRFAESHPHGTYVLRMAGHLVCCKDGKLLDTWDCSDKCVYTSFEVTSV